MKRKSGLHKKVSSIFEGSSLPMDKSSTNTLLANNNAAGVAESVNKNTDSSTSGIGGHTAEPQHYTPAAGTVHKTDTLTLTEDQEYAASQRRKLFLVIGLAILLALVLFFTSYKPKSKSVVENPDTSSSLDMVVRNTDISWPTPEVWPTDIRDPMVFKEDAARLYALESKIEGPFALRGIVHKPEGGSMALIGKEILYEGEKIDGWTIKEVLKNIVRLENSNGEKLELTMENR